jgi:uncharacterized membrane protein YkoI
MKLTIRDKALIENKRKGVNRMLKKVLTGTGIAAALTGMFLLGSLALGPVFAETPSTTTTTQAVVPNSNNSSTSLADGQYGEDDLKYVEAALPTGEQQPQYAGSIAVNEAQDQGSSEADETAAMQAQATITSAQAEAAALAANPRTTIVKTGLDNENGVLVYSVELSNGLDVKVDAGNGKILHTEQAGNDANEVAGAENTPEQVSCED